MTLILKVTFINPVRNSIKNNSIFSICSYPMNVLAGRMLLVVDIILLDQDHPRGGSWDPASKLQVFLGLPARQLRYTQF